MSTVRARLSNARTGETFRDTLANKRSKEEPVETEPQNTSPTIERKKTTFEQSASQRRMARSQIQNRTLDRSQRIANLTQTMNRLGMSNKGKSFDDKQQQQNDIRKRSLQRSLRTQEEESEDETWKDEEEIDFENVKSIIGTDDKKHSQNTEMKEKKEKKEKKEENQMTELSHNIRQKHSTTEMSSLHYSTILSFVDTDEMQTAMLFWLTRSLRMPMTKSTIISAKNTNSDGIVDQKRPNTANWNDRSLEEKLRRSLSKDSGNEQALIVAMNSRRLVIKEAIMKNYSSDNDIEKNIKEEENEIRNILWNVNPKLLQPQTNWFAEDGDLFCLKDPKSSPLRLTSSSADEIKNKNENKNTNKNALTFVLPSKQVSSPVGVKRYAIDIDVIGIQFHSHRFFSFEDKLQSQIMTSHNYYKERRSANLIEYFKERIKVLRECVNENNEQNIQRELQTQLAYSYHSKIDLEIAEYTLLKQIVRLWKQISHVRQRQGYASTRIRVLFQQKPNDETDRQNFDEDVEFLLNEQHEQYRNEIRTKVRQYEISLHEWELREQERQKMFEAHRQERLERRKEEELLDEEESIGENSSEVRETRKKERELNDEEEEREEMMTAYEEKPTRPTFKRFDRKEERMRIHKELEHSKRSPGKPNIIPLISYKGEITSFDNCDENERERRKRITETEYCVRLKVNENIVATTEKNPLRYASDIRAQRDFSVHFGKVFSLQVSKWPQNVVLQLMETVSEKKHKREVVIGEITVPIPIDESSENAIRVPLRGTKAFPAQKFDEEVGIGDEEKEEMREENNKKEAKDKEPMEYYQGTFAVAVEWGKNESGEVSVPQHQHNYTKDQNFGNWFPNETLAYLPSKNRQNKNPAFVNEWKCVLKMCPDLTLNAKPRYIRRKTTAEEEKKEHFEGERRLKLLKHRTTQRIRQKSSVPLLDSEVTEEMMDIAKDRFEEREETEQMLSKSFVKAESVELIKKRTKVIEQRIGPDCAKKYRFYDVVSKPLESTFNLLASLRKFLFPFRPLNPVRTERREQMKPNLLIVNILCAENVPRRRFASSAQQEQLLAQHKAISKSLRKSKASMGMFREDVLAVGEKNRRSEEEIEEKPHSFMDTVIDDLNTEENPTTTYCKVSLQNFQQKQSYRTQISYGHSPSWNETLLYSFTEEEANVIGRSEAFLKIELFDEIIETKTNSSGETIQAKPYSILIGSERIMMSSLFHNEVNQNIALETPTFILSHKKQTEQKSKLSDSQNEPLKETSVENPLILKTHITFDPPLRRIEPFPEDLGITEIEGNELYQYSIIWGNQFREMEQMKRRVIQPYGVDLDENRILLTRFIHRLAPPSGYSKEESILSFVRHIPLLPPFPSELEGRPLTLCTVNQIFTMKCGSVFDIAIVLCNFLLHYKRSAYVLIGCNENGMTAFVLEQKSGTTMLINPLNGVTYQASKGYSFPLLRDVYYVFNEVNLWANVQAVLPLTEIVFDFTNRHHWIPFFNTDNEKTLTTVQPTHYTFTQPSNRQAKELRKQIESTAIAKVEQMRRPRLTTRWSRVFSLTVEEVLEEMATNEQSNVEGLSKRILREAESENGREGTLINFTFTTLAEVQDRVFSLGIAERQSIGTTQIEYSLAVFVHALPADLYSVWLYLGTQVSE